MGTSRYSTGGVIPYDKNGVAIQEDKKKEIVTIAVTGNGYIIFPEGYREGGGAATWKNIYSFDNFDSLIFFLKEHLEEPKIEFKQAMFDAINKGEK